MKALCDLAQGVIGPRRSEEIVAAFTEKLKLVVPYDLCQVTLVMPETGNSVVVHAAGKRADLLRGRHIALGEGVTGWVIANRKPFCNTDPKLDLPPQLAEEFADCRTLAVFPLISDKEMHGAVTLYSSALAAYTQDHQGLIKEAASLAAKALSAASKPILLKNRSTLIADGAGSQAIFITTTGSLRMPDKALESELPQ
jgi:transcriptional regulator with GAF, ATPase, and Fis domain